MRSWRLAGAITLAIAVAMLVLVPFGRFAFGKTFAVRSTTCRSPIVSAWRAEPQESGWFGYAPLTSTPLPLAQPCRNLARHRLVEATVLAALALVLARRSRPRSAPPAGTRPDLVA